jgi:hypothetical protein
METSSLRQVCLALSALSILAGGAGMGVSFLFMASSSAANIMAGTSGFIAGSVFIGSGLVSLTMLATKPKSADRPNVG